MKRHIIKLSPFFISGILIEKSFDLYLASAVITALFLIFFIKGYKSFGLFCIIFLTLGVTVSFIHTIQFDSKYSKLKAENTYEGYIVEKNANAYVVKNYPKNYKVVLYSSKEIKAVPGDHISFNGKVQELPSYKKNGIYSRGINGYIKNNDGWIKFKRDNNILLLPTKFKYKIINALHSIDKEGGAFISGIVTGYTGELSEDNATEFQDLGISHILAVSGFNIGIIFYFVLLLSRKLNARTRYMLTLGICFIYTAIGGFQPSLFRAFLMILIVVAAKLLNRFHDIITGITLAALIMLIINSYYIYDIGFLLSFAATYGIVLLTRDIEDRIPKGLRYVRSELAVCLSAFIATLPLILWYKGYFSLISIPVNMILSPVIGIITIFSFASSILYLILGLNIILYPSVLIGVLFIKIVTLFSKFNIVVFPGRPSLLFIIIFFILIGFYFGYIKIKLSRFKRNTIYALLSIILLITLLYNGSNLKIHFINVGQGDSIFIETPDRKGILIDTGPKLESFSALKEKVIPYIRRLGFNSIDLLILTHFHNDHAGDYKYLLDNHRVNKIMVYKSPQNSSYKFLEVSRGNTIKIGNLVINVLYPEKTNEVIDDKNETCLVMDIKFKAFSMLLTGDAEKSVLDLIKGNYDVFKVSHHGSIKSFSTKMIDNSNIGTAIISVGKNNFGHPSRTVISYLNKKNIKLYRTDMDGDLTIVTNGENYETLFQ